MTNMKTLALIVAEQLRIRKFKRDQGRNKISKDEELISFFALGFDSEERNEFIQTANDAIEILGIVND